MKISIMSYSFRGLLSTGKMDVFGYLESVKYRYGLDAADIWAGRHPFLGGGTYGTLANTDEDYLRKVKDALEETRICAGEVYQNLPAFRRLFEERAADLAMIDLDLGLTGFLKVAHLAEAYGIPIVNHLASEILAHGIAAAPNGLIVGFYPWAQPLFTTPARIENGHLHLSHTPGLGLDLDEDVLRKAALS